MPVKALVKLARPDHWAKNVVVLMPVLFGQQMNRPLAWFEALLATVVFCLASSSAYIINDLRDRKKDQMHPLKKSRPLAAGEIRPSAAAAEAAILVLLSLLLATALSPAFLLMILIFLALQTSYTLALKNLVLIDVISIALGFVLRAAAGAVAIKVYVSPWLFICMFTICLFMGFCKRYNELIMLRGFDSAENHRPRLIEYTPELLTHLITVAAGIAVMAFLFYGLSDTTVKQFGTNYLIYTLPITVYAIFRFALVSMKGCYQDPTDLIWHDRPFQAAVALWTIMVLVIVLYGRQFDGWLQSMY